MIESSESLRAAAIDELIAVVETERIEAEITESEQFVSAEVTYESESDKQSDQKHIDE